MLDDHWWTCEGCRSRTIPNLKVFLASRAVRSVMVSTLPDAFTPVLLVDQPEGVATLAAEAHMAWSKGDRVQHLSLYFLGVTAN